MLGRTHRFHGYGSLKRVYGHSQAVRGQSISLRYSPRSANKTYRVAVVVSRKVSKSAVIRNRIRRRVYEQVRLAGNVPANTDLVFTVFGEQVAELPAAKLAATLRDLLDKAATSLRETAN
jgi:ribonuclease P protein component